MTYHGGYWHFLYFNNFQSLIFSWNLASKFSKISSQQENQLGKLPDRCTTVQTRDPLKETPRLHCRKSPCCYGRSQTLMTVMVVRPLFSLTALLRGFFLFIFLRSRWWALLILYTLLKTIDHLTRFVWNRSKSSIHLIIPVSDCVCVCVCVCTIWFLREQSVLRKTSVSRFNFRTYGILTGIMQVCN